VFRADANGQPLHFDNAGVAGGNEVFKDRETGSRWQQSSLESIAGPLKGTHLRLYPFLLTSWAEWRRLHGDTLVLKPLPGYADRIAAKNDEIRRGLTARGPAPSDVTYRDERLEPKAMVLGLDVAGETMAFPLDALKQVKVAHVRLGGKPVLVVHQLSSDTTTAFVAEAGNRALTFKPSNAGATELVDEQTGSKWDPYGACVSGSLKGMTLEPLILEPEYWFAWSEFHRGTKIYTVQ
jgi:hypothetical protein